MRIFKFMKLVINRCYGGFGLSPTAIKRLAEMKGRECYFFKTNYPSREYVPVDPIGDSSVSQMMLMAFDIPNPNEVLGGDKYNNVLWDKHHLSCYPDDRGDADLIRVVEELGSKVASGACAKLSVVEIPDGISYDIDDYDGMESVEETHHSWN